MKQQKLSKELMRFVLNPLEREKILYNFRIEEDNKYKLKIESAEKELKNIKNAKFNEIKRIENLRWEEVVPGRFAINRVEGLIRVNFTRIPFDAIKGAELNVQYGFRTITSYDLNSKNHASLSGALVGGVLFGPVGAAVGGMGKSTTKGVSQSNQITTCISLGVLVNVDGFKYEIVVLNEQVDESSEAYNSAVSFAQSIITKLNILSKTPVPNDYIKVEDEESVIAYDSIIALKEEELQKAIADKPTYKLPSKYRTLEQMYMSDEEYLKFLRQNDLEHNRAIDISKLTEIDLIEQTTSQKIFTVIGDVIFWILSIFLGLMSIAGFGMDDTLAGFVFLTTGLLINPKIYKLINKKLFRVGRWICWLLFIVGLIVGGIIVGDIV
ncbi:MAG: hypothetical protein IJ938_05385 [Clostridia bacterium]|nr:hypothetical protein [Clostridia bacterium]MBR2160729.1 hypothetical protein [Clostridia bacterium]